MSVYENDWEEVDEVQAKPRGNKAPARSVGPRPALDVATLPELPANGLRWPTKAAALGIWECGAKKLGALLRARSVKGYRGPTGEVHVDPAQMDVLFARLPAAVGSSAASFAAPQDPAVELRQELLAILRETRSQSNEVLRLVLDPAKEAMQLLREQLADARQRMKDLEQGWQSMQLERERLLNEQVYRDLAVEDHRVRTNTKEKAIELLKNQVPRLFADHSALGFLKSIDPSLIDTLIESGVLSAGQVQQLRGLVGKVVNGSSVGEKTS